jgi:hydrocephalus-inducing protein
VSISAESLHNALKFISPFDSFYFEPTETTPLEVCNFFSVVPAKGTLSPVDRPAQVQVIFKSTTEVNVKDQPILRCQVIEPNIGEEGETIASIPIKLSVRSVFSK